MPKFGYKSRICRRFFKLCSTTFTPVIILNVFIFYQFGKNRRSSCGFHPLLYSNKIMFKKKI